MELSKTINVKYGMNLPIPLTIIIRDLNSGGTENHLFQILSKLDKQRFSIELIPLYCSGSLHDSFTKAGINICCTHYYSSKFFIILHLFRRIHTRRPLVHTFLPEPYILGATIGLIAGATAIIMSRRNRNHYQQHHPFARRIERYLHQRIQVLLGNSNAVINDLIEEEAPPKKIHLIHNGIDLSKFSETTDQVSRRKYIRASLDIPESSIIITCVANLFYYKGHADLLTALASLKEKFTNNSILLIIGRDAGMEAPLKKQATSLSLSQNIHFLGERNDIPDLLVASDIGVLASLEEGFSNSVLECMAAGLPMVVTDVGGNAEAIIDGKCGYVIPPSQPSALASALYKLINNPPLRQQMGALAKKRVTEKFSIEACVAAYENLYESIWKQYLH